MANTLTGRIIRIGQTMTMPTKSGNSFSKRELVLDCTRIDPNGQRGFENTPSITFTQERCAMLDGFQPGQAVTVSIDIEGRYYQPKDQYYNDIRGWKIELAQMQQQAPQPMQQPAAQQPYAQPYQPQQQPYQQPYQPYQAPQPTAYGMPPREDPPF